MNDINDKIVDFEYLKNNRISLLEKRIKCGKINNLKTTSIRNLKIAGSVFSSFYPFIIAGAVILCISLIDGKWMFHLDSEKVYQKYLKNIDSNNKSFVLQTSYDDMTYDKSHIDVYNNWKLNSNNNLYERKIQRYFLSYYYDDDQIEKIEKMIKENDYDYEKLLGKPTDIVETSNNLDQNEINPNNNLYVRASIIGTDYNTFEYFQETREEDWQSTKGQLMGMLMLIFVLYMAKISSNRHKGMGIIKEFKNKLDQIISDSNDKIINIDSLKKEMILRKRI